jgi:beta-lactamase regulating signal transducer with metallopeptidase domain
MLALLLESALRSLLLGAAVWLGLKLFRVRNPHALMTAWTLVLVASLAMPALMRLVTVTVPAATPAPLAQIIWPAPVIASPVIEGVPEPARAIVSEPIAAAAHEASSAKASDIAPRRTLDWRAAATAVYVAVGGMLLARLVIGVLLTWRLVRAARAVRAPWAAGLDVRVSEAVGVPVTFGSTILLPIEYVAWSTAKRRAVLTHERAHVAHGDFYVLLLAAVNRAVFWFNPFAWWQFTWLAELAENISDDAAVEALEDRPRYAGILLDVAARRQRVRAALAMARPSTVRRRVERILATREAPARADWRQRVLVAGALLPVIALCAVTVARGTPPAPAASAIVQSQEQSDLALARYAGFYQATPRAVLAIAAEGDHLFAQFTGQPRFELTRASETDYVSATPPARISFTFDGEAPAGALVLRQNNREWRARRIDVLSARQIETAFTQRIAMVPDRFRDQSPALGSRAALLRAIDELRHGVPDYARMSPQLANALRSQLAQLSGMLTTLGAVQSVFFRGVGPGGYDIYGAQFANGAAEFRLSVAADGRIDDLLFRPNGDDTPGDVLACGQEASLPASAGTAPIRLTLFNESDGEIRLFGLNSEGTRQPHGSISPDRTRMFLTNTGRPLIVTDAAGQCLEILVPGLRTRFMLVRSDRPAAEPTWPSRRLAPRTGSEEALRQHIDALVRGEPRYDMMSEEVAAETRQQLLLQQAILTKLGPLRSMSFRAATQLDSDVYMAQFANGAAEWRIRLLRDGRIGGLALGPQY